MKKRTPLTCFEADIDGITFHHVILNGKLISGKDDLTFELKTGEIKNAKFSE